MRAPFRPLSWLPGPHAQTIGALLLRRPQVPARVRERVELPDGDFVDVDVARAALPEAAPIAVLVHGLEGSSGEGYILETARKLDVQGIRTVAFNFRSCSGELNRSAQNYHGGATADLRHVLETLALRYPRARIGLVGFSLGANCVLKLLAEGHEVVEERVVGAVAVSLPFDLGGAARRMERGLSRVYGQYLLRKMRAKLRRKGALIRRDGRVDLKKALGARTIAEYDELVTAPLFGFRDAAEYYETQSAGRHLDRIRRPALIIRAVDDPMLDPADIDRAAIAANPLVEADLPQRGGHVGFVAPGRAFWAESRAAAWLADKLYADLTS